MVPLVTPPVAAILTPLQSHASPSWNSYSHIVASILVTLPLSFHPLEQSTPHGLVHIRTSATVP